MTKAMATGAGMFGIAGFIWASYPPEILWCGSLGIGMIAFAVGLVMRSRRGFLLSTLGILVANVGGTHYIAQAVSVGQPWGSWSIVGMGLVVVLAACVAALAKTWSWAFPIGFGVVLIGLVKDTARIGVSVDVWGAASLLALVGVALLAFRSGRAYEGALANANDTA